MIERQAALVGDEYLPDMIEDFGERLGHPRLRKQPNNAVLAVGRAGERITCRPAAVIVAGAQAPFNHYPKIFGQRVDQQPAHGEADDVREL